MKIFFSGIEELTNEDGNPTSTGLAQAQTVFEKVKQRNCQDSIVGLSYVTTASNTGKDRGAMVRFQRLLLPGMPSSHCRAPGQDSGV